MTRTLIPNRTRLSNTRIAARNGPLRGPFARRFRLELAPRNRVSSEYEIKGRCAALRIREPRVKTPTKIQPATPSHATRPFNKRLRRLPLAWLAEPGGA